MKIITVFALTIMFSQALFAEDNTQIVPENTVQESSAQNEPVMVSMIDEDTVLFQKEENPFKLTELDLTDIEFYKFADKPNYKPRNTVIVGGLLPLLPIRSNIDDSTEDPGLFQKSVSLLLYFKQKF
jgi:hypothetical protein